MRGWCKQAAIDAGHQPGTTTEDAGRIKALERENRELKLATCSWVAWFNQTRLHGAIGHVPPVEYEADYYRHNDSQHQPPPGQPARY